MFGSTRHGRRPVKWLISCAVLALLAGITGAQAHAATAQTVRLGVGAKATPASFKPLTGATITKKVYVGFASRNVDRVDFYLNKVATGQPDATDSTSPFLMGTQGIDTSKLKPGTHTIRAIVTAGTKTYRLNSIFKVVGATSAKKATTKVPVGKKVVFKGDWETGDATQWEGCQMASNSGDCPTGGKNLRYLKGNEARQGKTGAAFVLNDGDFVADGERSEVSARGGALVHEGDERWYQFSMRFPENFVNPTGFFIPMQWHDSAGQPPLALHVSEDGKLQIGGDGTEHEKKDIGPIRKGQWVDYVLHVMFSNSASKGFVEAWENGKLTVPKYMRATMDDPENYFKMGIYRTRNMTGTSEVWHDGLIVTAP